MIAILAACEAITSRPGGDPAVPGACYSPVLAGAMLGAVAALLLVIALATWLERRRPPKEIEGAETVIRRPPV